MRKTLGILTGLILLLPCLAFSGSISIRAGYFIPRAGDSNNHDSDLWTTEFDNMTFKKSDFQNTTLGFFWERFLTRQVSFVIGVEPYSQRRAGAYNDYTGYTFDIDGYLTDWAVSNEYDAIGFVEQFDITHSFDVSITPIQASIKLTPFGRKASVIPYIGGGVSLLIWSVRLQGYIVDFSDVKVEDAAYGVLFSETRDETNFSVGYHAFAGILVPVASRLAFEAEVRYIYGKGTLSEFIDFDKFDLGGYQISLGLNFWF